MVAEVAVVSFGELIDRGILTIGDGYRAKLEELGGDGLIFLRAGQVSDTHIDFHGVDRFHKNLTNKVAGKVSQAGDVVVTTKGNSTGRVAFVDETMPSFVYSPHLSYWRSTDRGALSPGYLRYWSCSNEFRSQLHGLSRSTDMAPYLSLIDQRRLKITLLPPGEQRAIGHILGTLDDKIELNRRMNETLEAVARAIFKSWFVDFDPVRAKASGEPPESICRRLGLTPDVLALFPDSFQDSELGEIPKGWEPKRLADLSCYLNRGISPKYVEKGGVCVLNQKCVRDGKVGLANARRHDVTQRSVAGRELNVGDILVNSTGTGTLGRVAQVMALGETTIVDSHVTVVRGNPEASSPAYLFMAMFHRQPEIEALGEGSTGQTELSRARLAAMPFLAPPVEVTTMFDARVKMLRRASSYNDGQNGTLAELRDMLLPKLLSGELSTTPAEAAA